MKYLSRQQILARHPISSTTLDRLRTQSRIRSVKDPHRRGAHLYCDGDVAREIKKQEKALRNTCLEFTGGGVRWIARQRALDDYRLTSPRLDRWIEKGYVEARLKRIKGNNPARRQFVHAGQLQGMIAGHPHARVDPDWLTAEEAFREFHFGEPFLRKVARKPHRLLKRKVRTGKRFVLSGHGVWKTTFCRFDLQAIHKMIHKSAPPPPGWVTTEKAQSLGLNPAVLYYYHTHPCSPLGGKKLTAKRHPVHKLAAGGAFVLIYLLAELKQLARHNGYRPGQSERAYRDAEGTWWPERDASKMIQEHPWRLWNWQTKSCPHLDRPIRHKRVRLRLHHSKHGDFAEVYHEADLHCIQERNAGLDVSIPPLASPKPPKSITPAESRKKRGRKPVGAEEARHRRDVLQKWQRFKEAHGKLKDFLDDRDITGNTFRRYQIWEINSRKRLA